MREQLLAIKNKFNRVIIQNRYGYIYVYNKYGVLLKKIAKDY